jgi:hypothetical protein
MGTGYTEATPARLVSAVLQTDASGAIHRVERGFAEPCEAAQRDVQPCAVFCVRSKPGGATARGKMKHASGFELAELAPAVHSHGRDAVADMYDAQGPIDGEAFQRSM